MGVLERRAIRIDAFKEESVMGFCNTDGVNQCFIHVVVPEGKMMLSDAQRRLIIQKISQLPDDALVSLEINIVDEDRANKWCCLTTSLML